MFYGASEGRMLTRILRKMQASDPSANLRVKVPEPFVSQVSKIARPGHPARGKSRFLTAKAVRNDKKEKVLGCVRLRPCPSARYERGRLRLHRRSKSAARERSTIRGRGARATRSEIPEMGKRRILHLWHVGVG